MATFTEKLSGYLTTETAITWTSGQTLNSAVDNEFTDLSDEIDNSTNKYRFVDLHVVLASAVFAGTDSGIEVFLIPTVDGTNYPTWTGNGTADEQENDGFLVGFVATTATTAAQRMTLREVALPSGKYKFAFRNRAGVALAASGNSVSWRPWSVIYTDA